MAEGIVSNVVGRLEDLLNEEAQLLHGVRDEIQQVVTELMRIKTFLRDADLRISEHKVGILLAQVRDLVYDAEDVVETFLLKAIASERRKSQGGALSIVKRSVCVGDSYVYHRKFSRDVKDIQTRMQNLYKALEEGHEASSSSSETRLGKLKRFCTFSVMEPDVFVGFQGEVESLVGHLVNESLDGYQVVFIGGMGGLGKTTLASKIYNHGNIKKQFAGLAWVSIPQEWQLKAVLQRILISLVHEKKDEILHMEVDKLIENLIEVQQMKNCLIVLDNIWSVEAWNSLKPAFPKEASGSKLLLTSRDVDIAGQFDTRCFIHKVQLLNAEQSWELLRLKAFPKGDHLRPRDVRRMEEWGRKMVEKCAGLPLAIVVLGGILVTKPTFDEWEKVYHDSLSSLKRGKGLGENLQSEVFHILLWSYNVLPAQLKLCFLYMSKFSEDKEIEAETLYQLLIAEGLVLSSDKGQGETMREVAESYMGELVHKSMVQVKFEHEIFPQRTFKTFLVHDLMRDLSLSIAKGEDFLKVSHLRKVDDFHYDPSAQSVSSSPRHLVVYYHEAGYKSSKEHPFLVKKDVQKSVRSILLFGNKSSTLPPIVVSHVANFRFLRVFTLEGVDLNLESFSNRVLGAKLGEVFTNLVYLRYLSLGSVHTLMFPSVQNLVFLQTLKLDVGWDLVFPLTMSRHILQELVRLQHLYLPESSVLSFRKNFKLRFNGLSKLETLENFNTGWCEVKDLPELVSLQKLTLELQGSYFDVEEMMKYLAAIALSSSSCLQYLALSIKIQDTGLGNGENMLRQLFWKFKLERLSIEGQVPELTKIFEQQQIDESLMHITTLELSLSLLEEDPLAVLEKIPTLRELRLFGKAYVGKEMVCSATGFPKLTLLAMVTFPNLVKWRVEEGSMPILSELCIGNCRKLEELPEGLKFLNSLGTLKLISMSPQFREKVYKANGEQGPDFYKVAHVPYLRLT